MENLQYLYKKPLKLQQETFREIVSFPNNVFLNNMIIEKNDALRKKKSRI